MQMDDLLPATFKRTIGGKTGLVTALELTLPDRTGPADPTVIAKIADTTRFEQFSDTDLTAAGKGDTLRKATITAIGEGLERSAMNVIPEREDMVEATYHELESEHSVLDFDYLLARSRTAQGEDEKLFSPDTECYWVTGRNLLNGEQVFVPAQLIAQLTHRYDVPHQWELNSNGFAAGPDLESALLGGLYEVIERDAIVSAWYTQTEPTPVDISRFSEATKLRETLETPNRDVHVFELASTVDVPVVGGSFVHTNDEFPKFGLSGGAHCDPETAVEDAITELSQQLPLNKITGEQKAEDFDIDDAFTNFENNAVFYGNPENFEHVEIFVNGDDAPRTTLESHPTLEFEETLSELETVLEKLASANCTPIAIEKTPADVADVGVNVVKTFVPELLPLTVPSNPPVGHPKLADVKIEERPHPFP